MAILKKPVAGGSTDIIRSARAWSSISDVVNAYESGQFNPEHGDRSFSPRVVGIAHAPLSAGDAVSIKPGSVVGDYSLKTPHIKLSDPDWHRDASRILFVESTAIEKGVAVPLFVNNWSICNLDQKVEEEDQYERQYVMMSPDEEAANKMRAAASGPYRILAYIDGGERALIDRNASQPFWRYEILSDGFDSSKEARVKLSDIDGEEFTKGATNESDYATVTDTDGYMENQSVGDKGMCFLAGGKFHAIQAAC